MNYEFLTDEQKKSVRVSTLVAIESDHLANQFAYERAAAVGDEAQMKQFQQTMDNLEKQKERIGAMPPEVQVASQ